jgi:hypothetical protein
MAVNIFQNIIDDLSSNLFGKGESSNQFPSLLLGLGGVYGLGQMGGDPPVVGYQGGIPNYKTMRTRVPNTFDPNRRPGSGGQRYFSDITRLPAGADDIQNQINLAQIAQDEQVAGLAALNKANPAQQTITKTPTGNQTVNQPASSVTSMFNPQGIIDGVSGNYLDNMAKGGLADFAHKRGYKFGGLDSGMLTSPDDGMADTIDAQVGNDPVKLAGGEYIMDAEIVSMLGNGNTDAGAKVLDNFRENVRMAKKGTTEQSKEINPNKFLNKMMG